jgi:MoxR-like ATPase
MATQNPIEQEGTYPLPEAQLDRFFFKLHVGYSGREDLMEIINRTTSGHSPEIEHVLDTDKIILYQQVVREVKISNDVQDFAVRIVLATHPDEQLSTPKVKSFIRFGASPRAAQTLVLGGKVRALLEGRTDVQVEDIRGVVLPSLRHRCILNFEAEAEGISCDDILTNLIETLPTSTQ